ncbi:hypothetical protein CSAL01_11887 [Colletotrichum salicis]|uniref:Uncharacterized protein n=1 Tax=Colletotrichum salicis TaxID=1209931 RepID=A0A135TRR6_9PEZI|nr:hypothetical protein CSAL01_11887 [Colletotrichum salicis]
MCTSSATAHHLGAGLLITMALSVSMNPPPDIRSPRGNFLPRTEGSGWRTGGNGVNGLDWLDLGPEPGPNPWGVEGGPNANLDTLSVTPQSVQSCTFTQRSTPTTSRRGSRY